jgi:Outer membrane protein beta-barrel domain
MTSGIRIGMNLTTMTIKTKGLTTKPETPMGVHFGIIYELPLKKNFSILSGIVFSSKGADYKIDTVDISLTPTYIEIPVNLAYNLNIKAIRISLFGGPYAACAIGGYKIVSGNEFKYLNFGTGSNSDLKYFDFGFNFGIGVKIRSYEISAQYGIGLTNVSPVADSQMKNKVIGISITRIK